MYPEFILNYHKIPNHYRFKYQKNFSIAGIENLKNLEIK